ncbi:hypothetical protein IWQ60_001152 [Tieghemiomyces parasiticus]|uniref:Uncharacterized protein n=1 Tax=Tieghemiomyces parasiticus TaxID=78921 RepID=A0A9W8E253_9FUNG|nr:hypothetical protein IWQ60_001152 [Tieghemiomyces parasiticus]
MLPNIDFTFLNQTRRHVTLLAHCLQVTLSHRDFHRALRILTALYGYGQAPVEILWKPALFVLRHSADSVAALDGFLESHRKMHSPDMVEVTHEMVMQTLVYGSLRQAEMLFDPINNRPYNTSPLLYGYRALVGLALRDDRLIDREFRWLGLGSEGQADEQGRKIAFQKIVDLWYTPRKRAIANVDTMVASATMDEDDLDDVPASLTTRPGAAPSVVAVSDEDDDSDQEPEPIATARPDPARPDSETDPADQRILQDFRRVYELEKTLDCFLPYYLQTLVRSGQILEAKRVAVEFCQHNPANLNGYRLALQLLHADRTADRKVWVVLAERYAQLDPLADLDNVVFPLCAHYERLVSAGYFDHLADEVVLLARRIEATQGGEPVVWQKLADVYRAARPDFTDILRDEIHPTVWEPRRTWWAMTFFDHPAWTDITLDQLTVNHLWLYIVARIVFPDHWRTFRIMHFYDPMLPIEYRDLLRGYLGRVMG